MSTEPPFGSFRAKRVARIFSLIYMCLRKISRSSMCLRILWFCFGVWCLEIYTSMDYTAKYSWTIIIVQLIITILMEDVNLLTTECPPFLWFDFLRMGKPLFMGAKGISL